MEEHYLEHIKDNTRNILRKIERVTDAGILQSEVKNVLVSKIENHTNEISIKLEKIDKKIEDMNIVNSNILNVLGDIKNWIVRLFFLILIFLLVKILN